MNSIAPISYKIHVGSNSIIHNHAVRQEPAIDLTVNEALLATLATPPLFTPTSISRDASVFEYLGGDLTQSNPARVVVTEAYRAFGAEARIALLLSIGSGHPGVVSFPDNNNLASWGQFLEKLVADSEQKAQEIESQMGHLGIYHRFNIVRGLKKMKPSTKFTSGEVLAHTAAYLSDVSVSRVP
ncbi:hypothetical protein M408DRAFT_214439 [Serendipita vermifera MAFF 305830]|uniref:PNPLA domain-containing protein n=1 Tax=Serendipita vermifera MAFF 305830 TaxID=933852 RepID=A0A0C2X1K8_SERVB|nr:hypothetical protein M408DRAFT_214439 [Serendipita vermifera MAFF 305830]